MGRDPFGIFKEGEVHTISYKIEPALRNPGSAGGYFLQHSSSPRLPLAEVSPSEVRVKMPHLVSSAWEPWGVAVMV